MKKLLVPFILICGLVLSGCSSNGSGSATVSVYGELVSSTIITAFAGNGTAAYAGDGGAATAAPP